MDLHSDDDAYSRPVSVLLGMISTLNPPQYEYKNEAPDTLRLRKCLAKAVAAATKIDRPSITIALDMTRSIGSSIDLDGRQTLGPIDASITPRRLGAAALVQRCGAKIQIGDQCLALRLR